VRRAAQLNAARDDIEVLSIRGNVDTRLRKLAGGEVDALVLAAAGLARLGRAEAAGGVLGELVPAAGQGALLIEGRPGTVDPDRLAAVHDRDAAACVGAERELTRALQASCNTPVGAHARAVGGGELELRAWVGLPDGSAWISDRMRGPANGLGAAVAERLVNVTDQALAIGIMAARGGGFLHDIRGAIQEYVDPTGFSIVRQYVGHGVGRELHEDPTVPHYRQPTRGIRLRAGMMMTIEPMINAGTYETALLSDKWTVVTKDKVADRLDVVVALSAGKDATITLADGTVLTAKRNAAGVAPASSAYSTVPIAQLAICDGKSADEGCRFADEEGMVSRLRITTPLAAVTDVSQDDVVLSAHGPSARRVRWDVLRTH